ncbi:MAG: hypothetical protein ACTHJ4_01925 [Candidatus Nucleicultricaceae bacterium]
MKKSLLMMSVLTFTSLLALPVYAAACPGVETENLIALEQGEKVMLGGMNWEAASQEDMANIKKMRAVTVLVGAPLTITLSSGGPNFCIYNLRGNDQEEKVKIKIAR